MARSRFCGDIFKPVGGNQREKRVKRHSIHYGCRRNPQISRRSGFTEGNPGYCAERFLNSVGKRKNHGFRKPFFGGQSLRLVQVDPKSFSSVRRPASPRRERVLNVISRFPSQSAD